MEEYKIGEEVLITGLSGVYNGYDHIGKIGIIQEFRQGIYPLGAYRVKLPDFPWDLWYLAANITSAKEHKVLTILREYEKNRKVLQRQSRG